MVQTFLRRPPWMALRRMARMSLHFLAMPGRNRAFFIEAKGEMIWQKFVPHSHSMMFY